jgi:truncated hemoglobin YjbI
MRVALLETVADTELRETLEAALAQTAQHMINQPHEDHFGERGGVVQ